MQNNIVDSFFMVLTKRVVFALMLLCTACSVSDSTWEDVRKELAEIQQKDQQYRGQMDSIARLEGWQSKSVAMLWDKQKALDSANLAAVDRIITRYGYPPKSKVGDLAVVPFSVIQHADDSTLSTYYELIVGAGKDGDLRMRDVAQYQDHVLLTERQPQEYGTQIWIEFKKDASGASYDSVYLWPVRDREHVNEKRLAVGLDSLETHLRRYGIKPSEEYLIRRSSTARGK